MDEIDLPNETFAIATPSVPLRPVIVVSPHSGSVYPADLLAASALDMNNLRRSEDSFVDEIFGAAPDLGIPMLRSLVARAYVDVNREAWELDPAMFEDPLPDWVNSSSPRLASGLGTVARVVSDGQPIYRRKLRFAEAMRRIERIHSPFHSALEGLITDASARFGACLILDTHSMPSGVKGKSGARLADFVLGDRHGKSCDPAIIACAENFLKRLGYYVVRNVPYAGGYTTTHYGAPWQGRHALQIEVNRALYMDETRYERMPRFDELVTEMGELLRALVESFNSKLIARPVAS